MVSTPRLFEKNHYFHLYNCGVEKRTIFSDKSNYLRFMELINFYRYEQNIPFSQFKELGPAAKELYLKMHPQSSDQELLKILSYCQMPNHFHLLIKITRKEGVPTFMAKLSNSYTRYFNNRYKRLGSLFQGTYKSKEMPSDRAVLEVSRYIHLNPVRSKKTNPQKTLKPENYPYSSYSHWISSNILNLKGSIIDSKEANYWIQLAGSPHKYKEFVESMMDKKIELALGKLTLE